MELCGSSVHSVQNSSRQPPVGQDLTKATCDRVYFDSLFEPKEYEVASYIVSVVGGGGWGWGMSCSALFSTSQLNTDSHRRGREFKK